MQEKELTKENIIKYFDKEKGFIKHNFIHIEKLEDNLAILYADIKESSLNPNGTVHGGLIFALADTAIGTLCYSTGVKAVTVDSNISYLKPCKGNIIRCVATPIKVGKTIGVYKADIYNSKDELSAVVTANYMFLK